ncbi:CCAAT-box DNA binding subunit B [Cryptosporidium xiaoi]|uniref:CCAAT-box DNA binding subunit B n=1 Tax=Cryptosporidium xiaoi TaxID=659607 RepID=A0AAV9XYC6_9CRYT
MSDATFNSNTHKPMIFIDRTISNNEKTNIKKRVIYKNSSVNCSDNNLPINNIGRIMKLSIPDNGKISRESKVLMQKLSREFICCISLYAGEICTYNKRKVVNGEDIINALSYFGYEDYTFVLLDYLDKWKNIKNLRNARLMNNYMCTGYFYSGINKENIVLNENNVIQDYSQMKHRCMNNMIKSDAETNETINKGQNLNLKGNCFEVQSNNNSVDCNANSNRSSSSDLIINEYGKRNYCLTENESRETHKNIFYGDICNTRNIKNFSIVSGVQDCSENYNINVSNSNLFNSYSDMNTTNLPKQDNIIGGYNDHINNNCLEINGEYTSDLGSETNKEKFIYCYNI